MQKALFSSMIHYCWCGCEHPQTPWESKEARAVFRGATTNYPLEPHYNWRANPRCACTGLPPPSLAPSARGVLYLGIP